MHPGCTVLVVDDDDGIRRSVTDLLSDEGANVIEARDGVEALVVLRSGHVDIAIIDLMMPGMNGWELVEAMQNDPSLASIPFCIVSAVASKAPPRAACVLAKPFKIDRLIEAVDQHC